MIKNIRGVVAGLKEAFAAARNQNAAVVAAEASGESPRLTDAVAEDACQTMGGGRGNPPAMQVAYEVTKVLKFRTIQDFTRFRAMLPYPLQMKGVGTKGNGEVTATVRGVLTFRQWREVERLAGAGVFVSPASRSGLVINMQRAAANTIDGGKH